MSDKEIKQATEKIITEMLTESTGKAFMDSGDAYGRHWEENQKNGIKQSKQPCDFCIDEDNKETELIPIIPIFDYLTESLQYTEECQMLEKLLPHLNYDVLHYIEEIIENPQNNQTKLSVFEENMIFGSKIGNTYNGEDSLTQGFLYIWFEYNNEDYIAISIHNGCDVRGGYADIHIFKVDWAEEWWGAKSEANIYCKCGMHNYRESARNYILYWLFEEEVNKKFIYTHSYKDEDGNLRCKYCNELITSEIRNI